MMKIEKANKKAEIEIIKNAKIQVKQISNNIKRDVRSTKSKRQKRLIIENSYKRYSKIFLLYGQKVYLKTVPAHIRLKDVDELFEEGRFIEIYEKHGNRAYKNIKNTIISTDIETETGSKVKARANHIMRSSVDLIKKYIVSLTAILSTLTLGGNMLLLSEVDENHKESIKQNQKEVNDYIDYIENYGEEVKKLKLSDTENIMKVMDDMWDNIKGYGVPQNDLIGCLGLDMYNKYGVGKCRNMADDCAKKLNVINPEYNARVIAVDLKSKNDEVVMANIKPRFVKSEEPEKDNSDRTSKYEIVNLIGGLIQKESGNHAVIIMDIPDDNISLIVDPTNPSIGMYKDGKIEMFNSLTDDGMILDRKPFGEEILRGTASYKIPIEYLESFLPNKISEKEAEKKYGVKAQNDALDKVRKLKFNGNEFLESIKEYYDDIDYNKEVKKIKDEVIRDIFGENEER